jgi:hypothetical protein
MDGSVTAGNESPAGLARRNRMKHPIVTSFMVAAAFAAGQHAVAQDEGVESACPSNTPAEFHPCALEAIRSFEPPRTLEGNADLSGVWNLPGNAFEDLEEHPATLDDNGNPSIVVDPADGRVPMRAWADELRRENATSYIHPAAACFLSGVPYIMYRPGPYQILQTSEHVVILGERAHSYRIVYMNDMPPPGDGIRLWNGYSTGRWEGNTLVIETTHQNALPWLDQRARFYTEEAHVVERLTLVDTNTLHYEATFEDPNVYTRPFTIALAYRRNTDDDAALLEEGCYESNAALLGIYRGLGLGIYTGVSVEEARRATQAEQSASP